METEKIEKIRQKSKSLSDFDLEQTIASKVPSSYEYLCAKSELSERETKKRFWQWTLPTIVTAILASLTVILQTIDLLLKD